MMRPLYERKIIMTDATVITDLRPSPSTRRKIQRAVNYAFTGLVAAALVFTAVKAVRSTDEDDSTDQS